MQGFSLLQGLTMTPDSAWQDLNFALAKKKKTKKSKSTKVVKERMR